MNILKKLTTTQITALSFLIAILFGTLLLSLPCSSAAGEWTSFQDALFTATSSVCVTGLVVFTTATYWSLFGQIVILLLIQIGGLGIITITSLIMLALRRKFSLSDAMLLEDALNLNSFAGISRLLQKIVVTTLCIEVIFFLFYIPVFVSEFGGVGIWYSLFHSVSAFCNAGMDIIGETSLCSYTDNLWLNIATMLEIILGGIGFLVIFDIGKKAALKREDMLGKSRIFQRLSLHSKIAIMTTFILIFTGAALIMIFEWNNSETLGNLPYGERILASFFQSVTCRTAGFATISQSGLTPESVMLCCILMFIGGSPIGTAGGIKTTTVAVLIMSTAFTLRGHENVTCAKRTIGAKTVKKATAIIIVAIFVVLFAIMSMLVFSSDDNVLGAIFEVFSALGTVGLSRDYTASLNPICKLIITFCMYLGRIGPTSLVLIFSRRAKKSSFKYSSEDITVG